MKLHEVDPYLSSSIVTFIPGCNPGVIKNIWKLEDIHLSLMTTTQLSKLLIYNIASGNSFRRNKVDCGFDTTCVITDLMCTSCRNEDNITRVLEYPDIKAKLMSLITK